MGRCWIDSENIFATQIDQSLGKLVKLFKQIMKQLREIMPPAAGIRGSAFFTGPQELEYRSMGPDYRNTSEHSPRAEGHGDGLGGRCISNIDFSTLRPATCVVERNRKSSVSTSTQSVRPSIGRILSGKGSEHFFLEIRF